MQNIKHLTERSLEELDQWIKNNPEVADSYESFRRELISLRMTKTLEQAAKQAHIIMYEIADHGPIDNTFLPSFQKLASYLYKWEETEKTNQKT